MKRRILVQAAILALPASVMAQTTLPTEAPHPAISQASSYQSGSLIGTVSADRKSVVAEGDGSVWGVDNPDVLKGLNGHRVSLKCRMAWPGNTIQVISAKPVKAETKYAVNLGDAAFRR